MVRINLEPLDAAITWAVENPDEFYIRSWYRRNECGTTACIAGAIAAHAGWVPTQWTPPNELGESRAASVIKDGVTDLVSAIAAGELGLDYWSSSDHDVTNELFHAADLTEVIAVRNRLAAEQGAPASSWTLVTR